MISQLKGNLDFKSPTYVLVDCNGVGYECQISLHTYGLLPDSGAVKLFTHLSIKEDAHTLYGFCEESERKLFRLLISVSGVGPNTARVILSSATADEIARAIASDNAVFLQKMKGIGAKTAQRIIIELKDKVYKEELANPGVLFSSSSSHNKNTEEALSALVVLGFARPLAEKAVQAVVKEVGDTASIETLIKQALKKLY